jgi:hypothetical protein
MFCECTKDKMRAPPTAFAPDQPPLPDTHWNKLGGKLRVMPPECWPVFVPVVLVHILRKKCGE